ncbi:MAG: CAP domain-containing protein [Cyanobacteria bacterium P01_F01_bin.116]
MDSAIFAQEVLLLTNEFRAQNDLAPLTLNQELTTTAQKHSQAMASEDFFSHIGLNGATPWDRAAEEGYTASAMAENIAAGQLTPEQVVQGWINSPGHRANMLNSSYTELGVGYVELTNDTGQVNYNHYWTQLFGSGDLTPEADASIFESEPTTAVEAVIIDLNWIEDDTTTQLHSQQTSYILSAVPSGTADREFFLKTERTQEPIAMIQVDSHVALNDIGFVFM